jgi:phosphatidylglycerophosphate synthase
VNILSLSVRGMIPVSSPEFNAASPPDAIVVGDCATRVYGLSQAERLRRGLDRAGASRVIVSADVAPTSATVVLVRADHVYEERLLTDLFRRPGCVVVLVESDGRSRLVAAHVDASLASRALGWLRADADGVSAGSAKSEGLAVLSPRELASSYDEKLRKKADPYVVQVTSTPVQEIESVLFGASYKGVTDFVTKYLWPAPARLVTRWCAERAVRPNTVTAVSAICVLVAYFCFARGYFAVGLVFAWGMTFLDTVDGKLARVTLTSSKFGNVFDHGVDLIHPPFWYFAWWQGLGDAVDPVLRAALWVNLVGYVVGRLMEGFFLAAYKMEIHAWKPVDSFFRLITARRNPNLAILSVAVLLARPAEGFVAVAVWTILSLAFHAARIVQAVRGAASGSRPSSWLAE